MNVRGVGEPTDRLQQGPMKDSNKAAYAFLGRSGVSGKGKARPKRLGGSGATKIDGWHRVGVPSGEEGGVHSQPCRRPSS